MSQSICSELNIINNNNNIDNNNEEIKEGELGLGEDKDASNQQSWYEYTKSGLKHGVKHVKSHQKQYLMGAAIVGTAFVAPLAVVGILNGVGFGSGGVAAGSYAAGLQSGIGVVKAGSLFAQCQSIGAAGLGSTGSAISSSVGAATVPVVKKGVKSAVNASKAVRNIAANTIRSFRSPNIQSAL